MLDQVYLISSAILIAYNIHVGCFSVKKSAFRNQRTLLHNAPGIALALLGTALWNLLGYQMFIDPGLELLSDDRFWIAFGVWVAAFLANTFTGFVMIPLLPNVDPAVKREFVSLVLCQLSFLPVVLGQVDLRLAQPMRNACYLVSAFGLVFSGANLVLYSLDYAQGKSQKTRMPANEIMLFIAVSIVVPFPLIPVLANRFEDIQETYSGLLRTPAILMLLVLGTVGNMQVFHGTLAVRGKETVRTASIMVAITVVMEMILVFAIYSSVLGADGFKQYLLCVGMKHYCPSVVSK